MFRALLVLSLVAGVASPVDAAPAKTKASKVLKKKKAKKSKKQAKKVSRKPTRKSIARTDNMPKGFTWPPSRAMQLAEKACQAKLDELGVEWNPAESEGRIAGAVTLSSESSFTVGGIKYVSAYRRGAQKLDCQLAFALASFGPKLEELGVQQVTFGSIFRWTNVRVMGKTKNILSRHALGIAMDIVSFTDKDGRVALVQRDYNSGDELLLGIEEAVNASGQFRLLLTPKNDPVSHGDHFHLEVATDYTAPTS
ncbi:MAG: extensin family protein [Deltaproteobacteria bacterium]|nr:extensin family protein [Deltaproteobacteria bacterium]